MTSGYVQMEFPFVDTLPKVTTQANFWGKIKNFGNFLIGDWAKPVGIEYHALKKEGKPISIFDAYHRYANHELTNKTAIDVAGYAKKAAKEAAQKGASAATKEVSKGVFKSFLKSAGRVFGKYAIPVLCFAGPVINAIKELGNGGGIVGAIKELSKGCIGLLGYAAGTLFATAVLGLATGGWAFLGIFLLGALGGMAFDYVGKAILGQSTEEKLKNKCDPYRVPELYKQQQEDKNNPYTVPNLYQENRQMLAGNSFGGGINYNLSAEMQQAEARFQAAKRMFESRNMGMGMNMGMNNIA